MTDPVACEALSCPDVKVHTVEHCEKERHCPFAHQRRREEDRAERDRKDRNSRPVSNP